MSKRYNCRYCGMPSGKSETCRECKEKYPYQESRKGAKPFNRQEVYDKDKRRKT